MLKWGRIFLLSMSVLWFVIAVIKGTNHMDSSHVSVNLLVIGVNHLQIAHKVFYQTSVPTCTPNFFWNMCSNMHTRYFIWHLFQHVHQVIYKAFVQSICSMIQTRYFKKNSKMYIRYLIQMHTNFSIRYLSKKCIFWNLSSLWISLNRMKTRVRWWQYAGSAM